MTDAQQPPDEQPDAVPAPNPAPKEETDAQPPTHGTMSPGEGEGHEPQETPGQADPSSQSGGALRD